MKHSLSPDTFRIDFRGNSYTSSERARDFAILRAADVCLERHFPCFAIVNENNTKNIYTYVTPEQFYSKGLTGTGVESTITYTPEQSQSTATPGTTLTVRGFHARPDGIKTFDAAFLEQSIKTKYHLQ